MLQKCVTLSSDLENPNPARNEGITFHLVAYSKLVSPVISNFTGINPLKSHITCFLFHVNGTFDS